ncbi:MAG: hypothetical protein JXC32_18310 [Anaerolineae bacterium]|nr:hypothetical protein [Anaerolineae bacterium]
MQTIALSPHQIITLNDYPVHSIAVLRSYVDRCLGEEMLPLVPVIRKAIVRRHLAPELGRRLASFEQDNPGAVYFMLDGSHRTTALTLTGRKIVVAVYETDADIREAAALIGTGQILENGTLEHTLSENCAILNRHFQIRPWFMTVHQKTVKMLRENYITPPDQLPAPPAGITP